MAAKADAIGDLRPTAAKSPSDRDLAELRLVRDALVADRTATLNRGKLSPRPSRTGVPAFGKCPQSRSHEPR